MRSAHVLGSATGRGNTRGVKKWPDRLRPLTEREPREASPGGPCDVLTLQGGPGSHCKQSRRAQLQRHPLHGLGRPKSRPVLWPRLHPWSVIDAIDPCQHDPSYCSRGAFGRKHDFAWPRPQARPPMWSRPPLRQPSSAKSFPLSYLC